MAYSEQTDKITQRELNTALNDKINTSRLHVDDPVPHVSDEERKKWNKAASVDVATPSTDGLMSAEDKEKLDGIEAGANNYTHPKSPVTPGTYLRTKVNDTGHVIEADNPTFLDITVSDSNKLGGIPSDQYLTKGDTILQGDPQAPTPDGSNDMSIVNVNYLKLHYVPLAGNCTITGPITFNEKITLSKGAAITGDTTITGNASVSGTLQGNRVLAGQGTSGGYSFKGENGYDTGMFSNSEGDLYFLVNGTKTQFSALAKLASPNFTGTPTAPTPSAGTNNTQIATTAFTQTVVGNAKTELNKLISGLRSDLEGLENKVNSNYTEISGKYVPLAGNCTVTGPITFNGKLTLSKGAAITGATSINGATTITGNASVSGTLQGNKVLAGQGTGGGYSFKGESGYDTGMFSNSDGDLYFLVNGTKTQFSALAKLASPNFTGTPTAPTAAANTNNTQIATTAFTQTVVNNAKSSLTSTINSSISSLRTELKNEMSGNYVLKSDVSNTAGHIPRYNSSGHLVLPSGIEIW